MSINPSIMLVYVLLVCLVVGAGGERVRLVSDGPVMLDAPIVFTGRWGVHRKLFLRVVVRIRRRFVRILDPGKKTLQ